MRRLYWMIVASLFAPSMVLAQTSVDGQLTASNITPLIGEPFTVQVTITAPAGSVIDPVTLPPQWGAFEVQQTGNATTAENNGATHYEQAWTVIAWQTGKYQTPPLTITYQTLQSPEKLSLTIEPIAINVPSVLNPQDLNLRPSKPPLAMPYVSPLVFVVLGILLAMVGFAGRRYWKQRSTQRANVGVKSPLAAALYELQQIDLNKMTPAKLGIFVTRTLKQYIQRQHNLSAEEMTTEELLVALHTNRTFSNQQQEHLATMLHEADLIKFAQSQPKQQELAQLLQNAQRWLQSTQSNDEVGIG